MNRAVALAAWVPLTVTVVTAAVLAVLAVDGSELGADGVWLAVPAAAFAAVGGVVAARRPRNPQGWTLGTFGAALLGNQAALAYAVAASDGPALPLGPEALWLSTWVWAIGIGALWTGLQVFPDGRPVSSRWRWGVAFGLVGFAAVVVAAVLAWPVRHALTPTGSFTGYPGVAGAVAAFANLAVFGSVPIALASLIVRYRRGGLVERLQLKWLLSACGVIAAGIVIFVFTAPPDAPDASVIGQVVSFVGLVLLPTAIGVAVLRYRLYEIDRIISRTVTYAAVTAALFAVYTLVVTLPSAVFDLESDLLVAAATLAAAGVFVPVRRRVQQVVERRFNRARYDAARVVDRFGERLRDDLDLEGLTGDLRGVVASTVQPAHVSLWLPEVRR
ncbi:hypothetical protein BH23ACT10_BH23ACT10_16320 [soil metagenome]